MISFIVIGRNEGWRLEKCLSAVRRVAPKELIQTFEIIYVDSQSSDNSIEISKKYADKVFLVTGECNAAIGRNIGAKEASGDILFFLDGDMELLPGVLPSILDGNGKLIHPFMSGIEFEYLYDFNWNKLDEKPRRNYKEGETMFENVTGGLFVIECDLWNKIGGMDNRFVRREDYDFGLKMCKLGIRLMRLGALWVNHFTRYYGIRNESLTFKKYPALLSRKHFFEKEAFRILLLTNYSVYILVFCSALSLLTLNGLFILPYVFVLLYRAKKTVSRTPKLNIFQSVFLRFKTDIVLIYYFFSYYPKNNKENYIRVKNREIQL